MKMVLLICPSSCIALKFKDFLEAYDEMKNIYLGFWDEEAWEEEYDMLNQKEMFEKDGRIEFCDGDSIMTVEKFLDIYFL
jgi:hypothetical protein